MTWQPLVTLATDDIVFWKRTCVLLLAIATELTLFLGVALWRLKKAKRRARYGARDYEQLKAELDRSSRKIAGMKPAPGGVMLSAEFVHAPIYTGSEAAKLELASQLLAGGENAFLISRVYLRDPQGRVCFGPPVDVVKLNHDDQGKPTVRLFFRPGTFEQAFIVSEIVLATPDGGNTFCISRLPDGPQPYGSGDTIGSSIAWSPPLYRVQRTGLYSLEPPTVVRAPNHMAASTADKTWGPTGGFLKFPPSGAF